MDTIDFETNAIQFGSGLAPSPVGVAIWQEGKEQPEYLAWGHPSENNCSFEDGRRRLAEVWDHALFHHAKFDVGVASEHFGFAAPDRIDDTQFLIYLSDPHAVSVSLKPSSERILGMPPDEQDALGNWLKAQKLIPWNTKNWGHMIAQCPGGLVGAYSIGDVVRTRRLYDKLLPEIHSKGMINAYERELRLSPILGAAEHRGVRIDRERLAKDTEYYETVYQKLDGDIRSILGCGISINLDSGPELVAAILAAGLGEEEHWPRTPTGKLSTSRENLLIGVKDGRVCELLSYRGALKTLLGTFMRGWLKLSTRDGRLHPSWNSVRGDDYGTRTGRLSCTDPNLQNIPDVLEIIIPAGYPILPFMRSYILAEEGEVIVSADYKSQEMRMLAHFAEGRLQQIYTDDAHADLHEVAARLVTAESGIVLIRKATNAVGFGLIYGEGVRALSVGLGVEYETGYTIRNAYFNSMHGLREFIDDVSARDYVRTWGGRIIPVEPPKIINNRWCEFNYKLVNYLIQGSSADQTKESVIRYHDEPHAGTFLMTVHDEGVFSVPVDCIHEEVECIKYAMEDIDGFDVPFKVDVKYGCNNWHDLAPYSVELQFPQHLQRLSPPVQAGLYRSA
jgi:DNA polymerase I-like protein with 3'-5' exonuclease and polymerase domains